MAQLEFAQELLSVLIQDFNAILLVMYMPVYSASVYKISRRTGKHRNCFLVAQLECCGNSRQNLELEGQKGFHGQLHLKASGQDFKKLPISFFGATAAYLQAHLQQNRPGVMPLLFSSASCLLRLTVSKGFGLQIEKSCRSQVLCRVRFLISLRK